MGGEAMIHLFSYLHLPRRHLAHTGHDSSFQSRSSATHLSLPIILLSLLLILFCSTGLLACGGTASSSNTLLFGAPISLTGSTATEGHLTLEGYQLWVKEVNAHGGIKVGNTTYQVALKYYDDGSSPTRSAQLTQQLITADKVNFLLGPYGTSATLQDEAIAERYKIPMVEANGAAKAIFSRGFHYIFGVLSPASEYAKVMLEAALSLPTPPQTVAIISANDSFSEEVATAARDFASSHGMEVVYYQTYPSGATDLTGVLTALKTSAHGGVPDMLLGSGHESEAVTTMKECKQLNINAKLYAFTVGPATPDFITSLGPDANYVLGSSQWTPQERYQGIDFFGTPANYERIYKQTFGHEPSYQSAESTAAGLAFQYAIQNAGSIDPQKVRDALARLNITTFYGVIRFDATGANTFKPMATIQIQNGQVVTVYPKEIANAQLLYPTPPLSQR
ncbi:branched-chain amino acid ABC transporter substrate-binding protein [Thermogemmatispora aurantia]|uniref:Branched-chain amino acid ABC transporter substrate-binding protein n=1 Tax=Thermogemmatispora aurantia TaxID=2045279 RepID=A0A5J4KG37_9CHLR|nr:branched-chain amino acid ABC transporter substrate-binding protein [Thermogemmatispora aurantia]